MQILDTKVIGADAETNELTLSWDNSKWTALIGEEVVLVSKEDLKSLAPSRIPLLKEEDVEWVINEMGEIGVKINDQLFFLYKGRSYPGGSHWRHVYKREFGECCHPWDVKSNSSNWAGITYTKGEDGCLITSKEEGWSKKPGETFVKYKRLLKTLLKLK